MDKGISEKVESLFSDEEKDTLLRDFVSAYLRNAVQIEYEGRDSLKDLLRQVILKLMGAENAPEVLLAKYQDVPAMQFLLQSTGVPSDKKFLDVDFKTAKDYLLTFILALRQGVLSSSRRFTARERAVKNRRFFRYSTLSGMDKYDFETQTHRPLCCSSDNRTNSSRVNVGCD